MVVEIAPRLKISEETVGSVHHSRTTVYSHHGKRVLVYNPDRISAVVLKNGSIQEAFTLSAPTDFAVCGPSRHILYCPTYTTVVCRWSGSETRVMCHTVSPIVHLAVAPAFQMFALATLDGGISVYSLNTGDLVNRTVMEADVTIMAITPKFGFIAVFTENAISLLTVNGDIIKTVPFHRRIVRIFMVSTCADIDYIVFETSNHELAFFEAFYPENLMIIYEIKEEIAAITYS
jgi:WD40 repeat protein